MVNPRIRLLILLATICIFGGVLQAAGDHSISVTLQPAASRQPAPAFRIVDAAGRAVSLSDYRGKVVLLDFWATACGGCKLEIPWFMEIAAANKTTELDVVGVSEDILYEDLKGPEEAWTKVTPWVESHKVNYPILMGDDRVTKDYNITALPATYLVDRNGRIAAKYVGLVNRNNLQENITKLLTER